MAVDNTNDDASKQLNAPPAKPAVAGVLKVTTALPLAETPPAKSAVVAMPKVTTALSLTAKPSDKPAAPSINPAVFLTTPTAPFWKSTVSSSSPTPPPVWPFLSPSVQVNPTTVIGETAWQTAAAAAPDLKRKITDPNLEIVTIDPFYDLTVIVGTPSPIEKQVAFRVNKGSMRHASDVWRKMLTGPWAENRSPEPEITFPEDSPWAFEQILRIAHWQAESVSSSFNVTEMKALAVLTDKYDLAGLMKMPTESKGWLVAARRLMERHWPSKPDLQDWAFIAYAFQSDDNYQYLISRMAVETQVDVTDAFLYHITDDARRTRVRSNLPDRLLRKWELMKIVRLTVLTSNKSRSAKDAYKFCKNGSSFATPPSTQLSRRLRMQTQPRAAKQSAGQPRPVSF